MEDFKHTYIVSCSNLPSNLPLPISLLSPHHFPQLHVLAFFFFNLLSLLRAPHMDIEPSTGVFSLLGAKSLSKASSSSTRPTTCQWPLRSEWDVMNLSPPCPCLAFSWLDLERVLHIVTAAEGLSGQQPCCVQK